MRMLRLSIAVAIIYAGFWYVARNISIYEFVAIAILADLSYRVLVPAIIKEVKARREIRALNQKWRQ